MKKYFGWLLVLTVAILTLTGCSTETQNNNSTKEYKIEEYLNLAAKEKKNVNFGLKIKDEKNFKTDLVITNKTQKVIKFNTKKFKLSNIDSKNNSNKTLKVYPDKVLTIKDIFSINNFDSKNKVPNLTYNKVEIKDVVLNGVSKKIIDKYFETNDNPDVNDDDNKATKKPAKPQQNTEVNPGDLTKANWTQGVPKEIIGTYVSDPSSYSTSMEKNFKFDLTITSNEFKLIPRAQMDGFFLSQLEYTKLDNRTFVLHGIALGNTNFYEKINLKENGAITYSQSQDTPNNFGEEGLVFHKQ